MVVVVITVLGLCQATHVAVYIQMSTDLSFLLLLV